MSGEMAAGLKSYELPAQAILAASRKGQNGFGQKEAKEGSPDEKSNQHRSAVHMTIKTHKGEVESDKSEGTSLEDNSEDALRARAVPAG